MRQLRYDARTYLGIAYDSSVPLSQIFRRLSKNKAFLKKRELKLVDKELSNKDELQNELVNVNQSISQALGSNKI